jgi:hypothetical protein
MQQYIHHILRQGTPQGAFASKDTPWPVKISFVNKIVPLWSGKIVAVASGERRLCGERHVTNLSVVVVVVDDDDDDDDGFAYYSVH